MTTFKSVAGSISIAPVVPCVMGCGDYEDISAETRDSIEANMLLLDFKGEIFAVITIDALYIGKELRVRVERIFTKVAVASNIFISASHTHYAPMLDTNKQYFGNANLIQIDYVENQLKFLLESLLECNFQESHLVVEKYKTNLVSNRRRKRFLGADGEGKVFFNQVWMQPSRKKVQEKSFKIEIQNNANLTIAVLWQFPCHPTSLPLGRMHSSHYVGYIRQKVREAKGDQVPFLFFQGFSGDLRPPSLPSVIGFKNRIRHLVLGSWFINFSEQSYSKWLSELWVEYSGSSSVEEMNSCNSDNEVTSFRSSISANELFNLNDPLPSDITFHKLDIASISILGVSAEVVSDYAAFLESEFTDRVIIPVGCIDDTIGYFPTDDMINEGGYESMGFLEIFGIDSFKNNFEIKLKSMLKKVIQA